MLADLDAGDIGRDRLEFTAKLNRRIGLEVVSSVSTLADAKLAAEQKEFDGAILDINVAGEAVYPVAEILQGRRKPFVFVTGYRKESIDPRFGEVPVLQKPIDRNSLAKVFSDTNEKNSYAMA